MQGEEECVGSPLVAHTKEDGKLCFALCCSQLAAGTPDLPSDWQRGALIEWTTAERQNQLWLLLHQRPKAANKDLPVMRREGKVLYISDLLIA